MCSNRRLINGIMLACKNCEECRRSRRIEAVARLTAEALESPGGVDVVTLTYGRDQRIAHGADHPHALKLCYADFQKFIRRVRRFGHPVRYFVAGEYGSNKGRAHWHAVLFWKSEADRPSNIYFDRRYEWTVKDFGEPVPNGTYSGENRYWDHGWVYFDEVSVDRRLKSPILGKALLNYVMKYVTKEVGSEELVYRASANPPLGGEYASKFARRLVEEGLPLIWPHITLPGELSKARSNGKREQLRSDDLARLGPEFFGQVADYRVEQTRFGLSRSAAEHQCAEYIRHWRERYGNDNWPYSPAVERYLDILQRRECGAVRDHLRVERIVAPKLFRRVLQPSQRVEAEHVPVAGFTHGRLRAHVATADARASVLALERRDAPAGEVWAERSRWARARALR